MVRIGGYLMKILIEIPENFQERVLNKRSSFDKYSQTFEDLCKFMKQKKDQIEDDTSRLVSEINNSGVL